MKLGVSNNKDYPGKSPNTVGQQSKVKYALGPAAPGYTQVSNNKDYPNKVVGSVTTNQTSCKSSGGFKPSSASPGYQQVGNSKDYKKSGKTMKFASTVTDTGTGNFVPSMKPKVL